MSANIKTITIYNSENQTTEEKNIGVDMERVDCGESTLNVKILSIDSAIQNLTNQNSENNSQIELINTSIQSLNERDITTNEQIVIINNSIQELQNKDININSQLENINNNISNLQNRDTAFYCPEQELQIGHSLSRIELPEEQDGLVPIASYAQIQNGFSQTLTDKNILTEDETIPTITATQTKPNLYAYQVVSSLFLRKALYGLDSTSQQIHIITIPKEEEETTFDIPMDWQVKSNIIYDVVDNNQINSLTENQMILAEALLYSEDVQVGDKIRIIIYTIMNIVPVGGSSNPLTLQCLKKENLINFNKDEKPNDNYKIYNAQTLWEENQFLRNCIKDLYAQITELKNS